MIKRVQALFDMTERLWQAISDATPEQYHAEPPSGCTDAIHKAWAECNFFAEELDCAIEGLEWRLQKRAEKNGVDLGPDKPKAICAVGTGGNEGKPETANGDVTDTAET